MIGWRAWAITAGGVLAACGVLVWSLGDGPVLLILRAVVIVTAAIEPIYGRAAAKPVNSGWRPTDEKFVDTETGQLVTVWFDPDTGERRYVEDRSQP